MPHLGHATGEVITDAATVDVNSGVPVDIPASVLTGLVFDVMVEAVAKVMVAVVCTACITLLTSVPVHTICDIDPDEPTNISLFCAVE